MAITRWDPMHDMRHFTRHMERMFEPFAHMVEPWGHEHEMHHDVMFPCVDIYEDKEEITFRCELPGMERKHVELRVEENYLTVRGERHLDREEKKENYHRIESTYGAFSRTFTLPLTADREHVRAEMKDGVLVIHVPKREGAKGKTIAIGG
jgi:HSP20 family protein